MSFLVRYTLKSADDRDEQIAAMEELVAGLKSEGIADLNYSCFSTDEATAFIGVLDFANDTAKQGFLDSASFAAYRDRVTSILSGPPSTENIFPVASTHG